MKAPTTFAQNVRTAITKTDPTLSHLVTEHFLAAAYISALPVSKTAELFKNLVNLEGKTDDA